MRTFWTTSELRRLGVSPREIRRRTAAGVHVAVRNGWFAAPTADPQLVRAVRLGGLATAQTAARSLGLWTPPDEHEAAFRRRPETCVLHVAVARTSSLAKLRDPDTGLTPFAPRVDVTLRWTEPGLLRSPSGDGRVPLLLLFEHLFALEPPERALAVLDSALHLRHLHPRDLADLARRLPAPLRPTVFSADGRAESGIETIVRFRLRALGLRVELQVPISGSGRVDLLIDGRLIIECDGREWHEDEEAFQRDRQRDLSATRSRYRTLRVTWFQVLFRWADVEAAVFAALG